MVAWVSFAESLFEYGSLGNFLASMVNEYGSLGKFHCISSCLNVVALEGFTVSLVV